MKIYFDMDNVLADFSRGVRERCKIPPIRQDESTKEADTKMWEAISKVKHFYDELKPVDGAVELFQLVYERYGSDCEILTAIPKPDKNIKNAAEDKIKWTHRILSPHVKVNIVFKEEKKNYCTGKDCILIDDLSKNIEEWKSYGGTGILFENTEKAKKELEELGVL